MGGLLTAGAIIGGAVLTVYGGLFVIVGGLALSGVIGQQLADLTALRWQVFSWDPWLSLLGVLLLTAGLEHTRLRRRNWPNFAGPESRPLAWCPTC